MVMGKKLMDEDWQVVTSVSLPKILLEVLKLQAWGPRFSISLGNVPTSSNSYLGTRLSTIFENIPTSTNSYRTKTVNRLKLSRQVKKVLFKCDCEEKPLWKNEMGVFQLPIDS